MATLKAYTKSTYGSPYAYYKFTATEVDRTSSKVKIKVTCSGYLASSSSLLGSGLGLKAGVYIGGSWHTWTLKSTSSSWSGTTVHSASETFTISAAATTTKLSGIKVRVLRSDSYGNGAEMSAKDANSLTISSYAIPTIPTTSAVSSIELGGSFAINIAPQSSSYLHTLTWTFGNLSGTIGDPKTKVKTFTFSPDTISGYTADAFGAQIPSKSKGTLTIKCTTYLDGEAVGSKSTTVTMTVPSYTLSVNQSFSEANANNPFANTFVQGISKIKVSAECASYYGATLAYKHYVAGMEISGGVSGELLTSGAVEIKTVVTDSRGISATDSDIIEVYPYAKPVISIIPQPNGASMQFKVTGTVSSVNNLNSAELWIEYYTADNEDNPQETPHETGLVGTFSGIRPDVPITIEVDKTYTFTAKLEDKYDEGESNDVTTGVVCISRFASGKGVTLFEEASGNGFKVGDGQPSHFTGPVSMDNPLGFPYGGLGANSREQALINLLGYTPSYIQVRTTVSKDNWSTSLQYFYPYATSAEPVKWSAVKGNLTLDTEVVTFGDREGITTYGVRVGKNINTVRVHSNVYFLSETESPTGVCATIYRWRESAEQQLVAYSQAFTHVEANNGSYGTCTSNAIIAVKEGDFIFIGAWKSSASRQINTPANNGRTNMIVEAIG